MSRSERYGAVATALHWAVAVLAFAQIALGWWMIHLPDKTGVQRDWFNLHKSFGITIGLLMLARLVWRLRHAPPPLPASLPRWQAITARVNHRLLYAALLVQPIVGYVGSSFTSHPTRYFGFTLPTWGWDSPPIKAACSALHFGVACFIVALVALHIAAALSHLARRDGVFDRMSPRLRIAWPRRDVAARPS